MTLSQIRQQALELDPAKRLRLVQEIWDSLVAEPESVRIPKRHRRVVDQRVAEHDADPGSAITLDQAKSKIRRH